MSLTIKKAIYSYNSSTFHKNIKIYILFNKMMPQKELSKLYSFLSNDNQTFEQISKSFNEEFDIESRIKALNVIIILLKDNMLNLRQRIISYFILYDTSQKGKIETNPFLFIILDRLENSNDKKEQNFLIDFLYKKINYLNMTINQYLNEENREMRINLTQVKMQWDKYYQEFLNQNNININSKDKIKTTIYNRTNKEIKNIFNSSNVNVFSNVNSVDYFNFNYFKTDYMSYRPVNNNFVCSEPIILLPHLNHNFIWEKD